MADLIPKMETLPNREVERTEKVERTEEIEKGLETFIAEKIRNEMGVYSK